ncbi:hypothetical protein I9Y56_003786, partial [Providencia stuartii]
MRFFLLLYLSFFSINSMASCANLSSSSGFKQEINTRTVLRKTNFHLSPVYNKEVAGLFIIKGDTFTSYLKSDNFLFG